MKKVQKSDGNVVKLSITDGLDVVVIRDEALQWLMPTRDVAIGYGVSPETVRGHLTYHKDELHEGVHFIRGVGISNDLPNGQPNQIYWTKAGVVRLGFFIKSERAKMFRDWAESIVLSVTAPKVELPAATRRNHNRLTQSRLVELLSLVALVDDKDVRTALVRKLMPDMDIPSIQLQLPLGLKGGAL